MKDYYQENYLRYYDETVSIDPASFLSPLVRCLPPGGTILDVGCGSGRDMCWLKDRGFRPEGFEWSGGLAALARAHSGCPVREGDFEVYGFTGMDMDAILLVGAMVHVPHERFQEVFSNILRALKPRGHVLLTLKEGNQDVEVSGGRIFYRWRDESLRKVFDQLNLTVVDFSRQVSKIRESDVWLGYVLSVVCPRYQ
ncbi:MAG: class I SAM-dependent methyltransferase [Deltaproteobacteria bacterium]|jgi:SAM-dependent methyltransferase|nr:class I SAM-dependent methyltransferase [Deltaproteobacteria bacterium]